MTDFQSEMDRLVSEFVAQITDLVRQAAINMLQTSLGGTIDVPAGRRASGRAGKRSGADLSRLADQFVAFVARNPGLRVEQINHQLGTTTKDLELPIRKLVANGTVKVKGKKRATTYYPK